MSQPGHLDEEYEPNRIYLAYLKHHRINPSSLTSEEHEIRMAEVLARKHLYPVPLSEPAFLFHGTCKARLPLIGQGGLKPSDKSWFSRQGAGAWSIGKVFLAETVNMAEFYASIAGKKHGCILRIPRLAVPDLKKDGWVNSGSWYVERAIPVEQVQVWAKNQWVSAQSFSPALKPSRPVSQPVRKSGPAP